MEQQPLSREDRGYVLYCLARGKGLIEETRQTSTSADEFVAIADRRIMEFLTVSETVAQEIRRIILLYAADHVRSDIQQYHELYELGGAW